MWGMLSTFDAPGRRPSSASREGSEVDAGFCVRAGLIFGGPLEDATESAAAAAAEALAVAQAARRARDGASRRGGPGAAAVLSRSFDGEEAEISEAQARRDVARAASRVVSGQNRVRLRSVHFPPPGVVGPVGSDTVRGGEAVAVEASVGPSLLMERWR